ncbi:hypothetical protein [Paraburkholderia caribensis]|uniref:hypothetical protein n=1 Tax=Paraburkholderia caribensis TaxID=75105 RepID=UPI001CB096C8|nr:hypothetical protein [Paraburkholderia caribensis]CAG9256161.1 hypothetical protein PCAR4_40235 [Paraburkholderia caribensis]
MTNDSNRPRMSEGVRVPALKSDEVIRPMVAARHVARVIDDACVQYVIDTLIHASLALASLQSAIAFDDEEEGDGRVIDNSKTLALIDCALCRLGVSSSVDLPVREVSSCTDRVCERRNTGPSTVTP